MVCPGGQRAEQPSYQACQMLEHEDAMLDADDKNDRHAEGVEAIQAPQGRIHTLAKWCTSK